jgi:hypothetical protein
MREALNGFVIRGVSSNIPFQAALLAHPKFVAGDFNTGFIAENYGHGFRAEDVPHQDAHFLTALAAFVRRKSRERTAGMSGQLPGYGVEAGKDYEVIALSDGGSDWKTWRVRDVATLAEAGMPGFELTGNQGITVPAATPKAVVERLGMEILRAVGTPLFKETLARQGLTPAPLNSAEYDALLRAEFSKMQKMFRDTAVKLD